MPTNATPTALEQFYQIVIQDAADNFLPKRPIIKIVGTPVDDPVNNRTIVTLGLVVTQTTANYTQPAVGATVTVAVNTTALLGAGLNAFVVGGGYYQVVSVVDSTHVQLQNLGTTGNAAPTVVVNTGALVVPSGPAASLPPGTGLVQVTAGVGSTLSDGTAGQILTMVGAAKTWAAPAPGVTFAVDLVNSTATAQYVSSISVNAAGAAHGAGGAVAINGTGTLFNWVDDVIVLQKGGSTRLQLSGASGVSDFIRFGPIPATSGQIRFPSNTLGVTARNVGNTVDVALLSLNSLDELVLGGVGTSAQLPVNTKIAASTGVVLLQNTTVLAQLAAAGTDFVSFGVNAAQSGPIRVPNNVNFAVGRNAANSGDIYVAGVSAGNAVSLGDGTRGGGILLAHQTGGSVQFQANNAVTYATFAVQGAPQDGMVLTWDNATTKYMLKAPPVSLPAGTGIVRVDAGAGSVIADGTADQLFGRNHANTADAFFTLIGDGTVVSSSLTVKGLQTQPVVATTPVNNNFLLFESSFNPASLTGLKLWLRSDLGVTQASSLVSQWTDQSLAAWQFVQATGANQPTYSAAGGVNGLPYISAPINSSVISLVCSTFTALGVPFDIFICARPSSAAPANDGHMLDFGGASNPALFQNGSTATIVQYQGGYGPSSPAMTVNVDCVIEAQYNSGNVGAMGLNGTVNSGSLTSATTGTGITLFNYPPLTGSHSWNGWIYEIAIFDHILSATDRNNLLGYFQARYSVTCTGSTTPAGAWTPQLITGDVAMSGLTPGLTTVMGLQRNTVTAGPLTKGQFLVASSATNWAPTTLSLDVSESAVTAGALTVVGLQGAALPALPGTDKYLHYTGSAWVFSPLSVGVTWANDLSGNATTTSTNQYVSSLSYSSAAAGGPIAINGTATSLAWAQNAAPLYNQSQQANGSNPVNMTFAPQAPGAGAASTATGTPGNFLINLSSPVSTGTQPLFKVNAAGGGTPLAAFGYLNNVATAPALWLSGSAPSGTNYALYTDNSGQLFVNAPATAMYFGIANVGWGAVSSNGWQFGGTTPTWGSGTGVVGITQVTTVPTASPGAGIALWANTGSPGSLGIYATGIAAHRLAGTFTIKQDIATTDAATTNVNILGQGAWSSATTNTNGGFIQIQGGGSKTNNTTGILGGVRLLAGDANVGVEVCAPGGPLAAHVVGLCHSAASAGGLTATQMPVNSGDGVVWLGITVTDPTANPVGGSILYSSAGVARAAFGTLTHRGAGGAIHGIGASGTGTVNSQLLTNLPRLAAVRLATVTATTADTIAMATSNTSAVIRYTLAGRPTGTADILSEAGYILLKNVAGALSVVAPAQGPGVDVTNKRFIYCTRSTGQYISISISGTNALIQIAPENANQTDWELFTETLYV